MSNFQLSVVDLLVVCRLPQSYRWLSGYAGIQVEPLPAAAITDENNKLLGLKLLGYSGIHARNVMQWLHLSLKEILLESTIIEWKNEPCLFVSCHDESAVICHLKNVGVAIAETPGIPNPC